VRGILTYHSIDGSGSPVSVPPEAFDRHVTHLASAGIRVASVAEILAGGTDGDAVAITFDDAFANFASEAWPRLADHGFPVTLFVATARVGATNAWGGRDQPGIPTLPLLDWDALGRLADAGVSLQAHSRSHVDLRRVSDAQLEDEVAGAIAEITARTGARVTGYAYPYGAYDPRVVAGVARAAEWACTTRFGPLHPADGVHELPRLDAYYFRGPAGLVSWGTARFRARIRLVRARRWIRQLGAA
jgi:peptidoglycan/xylan/chitin deacetylase (PgdA/CDA1 family)